MATRTQGTTKPRMYTPAAKPVAAAATLAPRSTVTATLPYPPSVNNLYATVRGRRVLSAAGRAYKEEVRALLLARRVEPFCGPVILHVYVYRPRRAGDLDNSLKALQDALTGVLWADDRQIVEIHAYRREDPQNPRAVVSAQDALPQSPDAIT